MNLIEALRIGRNIRRPIPKHKGSHGTGWLSSDYLITILCGLTTYLPRDVRGFSELIDASDLLADDWEIEKGEESK